MNRILQLLRQHLHHRPLHRDPRHPLKKSGPHIEVHMGCMALTKSYVSPMPFAIVTQS